MRKAVTGKETDLGFIITPRKSRRHSEEALTDLDDITILKSNKLRKLLRV